MVWPILISVGVTPRISAAIALAGSASVASTPSAPNLVTTRIGIPSPVCAGLLEWRPLQARVSPALRSGKSCHGA
jgi:hypothetical protein